MAMIFTLQRLAHGIQPEWREVTPTDELLVNCALIDACDYHDLPGVGMRDYGGNYYLASDWIGRV